MHLGIIGLGLIGGSIAMAARRRIGCDVIAYDTQSSLLKQALQQKYISTVASCPEDAAQADMVVIAAPVGAYPRLIGSIASVIRPQTVMTDVGSAKGNICSVAQDLLGEHYKRFIPAHPIAGKEKSGLSAASGRLLDGHITVLCEVEGQDESAFSKVQTFWTALGTRTVTIPLAMHDTIFAQVSHLPHMLSYAMAEYLRQTDQSSDTGLLQYAGGGFRDFTRTASSSPRMWHDICMVNSRNISDFVRGYQRELSVLLDHIEKRDSDQLLAYFTRARDFRERFRHLGRE